MSDANVSHLGQIEGSGALDALWLKVFAGEILNYFNIAVQLKGTVRSRSLRGAKQATFPAVFNTTTYNHVPGTEILGQNIQHNEVVVSLDDLVISPVFIAQIEELKNYFDVRGPYAEAIGQAQALYFDRVVSQVLAASAAVTSPLFVGDTTSVGTTITDQPDVGASADFTASGADLISAVNLAKQKMEEKLVPVEQMLVNAVFKPAQWFLIANSDKALNRFYSDGANNINRQVLRTISDIHIRKSNAVLFGYNVTPYNSSTNATGVVDNAYPSVPGTTSPAVGSLPYGKALPYNFPAKYQTDMTKVVGQVWTEPAAAVLELLGVTMESMYDMRRQGTLMLTKQALGAGPLRPQCAVTLKVH